MFDILRLYQSFLFSILVIMFMTIDIKFDFSKATKVLSLPQTLNAFKGGVPFGKREATVQADFNGDQIQDLFSVQGALLGRVLIPVQNF